MTRTASDRAGHRGRSGTTRWARWPTAAGLRRRRALVGRPGRVPAGRLLAVPADHRGDGRAAPASVRAAEARARAAPRGVHAADHPGRLQAGPRAGRGGLRRLARPGRWPDRCRRPTGDAADPAGHAQAQDHADLGAVDPRAAGQQHRLRRRGRLAGLVPPPVDRAGPADHPVADQGRPMRCASGICRPPALT